MIAGHPALKLLAQRKLLGILRKQFRRLRTAKGILLALIGLAAIGLWIWSITSSGSLGRQRLGASFTSNESVRLIGASIVLMSLISALSFRGLYLPREEIELLFAAPVSRSDVIRYRLWSALGKSLFGSVFFGLIVMKRVPVPVFGFVGAFLAMMTLPVASQIVSLFAGDMENRWIRRMPKNAFRVVNIVGICLILALLFYPRVRGDGLGGSTGDYPGASTADFLKSIPSLPFVSAITLPFWPWASLITSSSPAQFLEFVGVCVLIWWGLYQACVRISIDYRELSLETSADVAKRLARMRRGAAGASAGKADASSAGWRVPWLFGRGPFGALAWRKTGTILRKARGTLLISGALVGMLVLATTLMTRGELDAQSKALGSSAGIAAFGTIYLCSGLRFDFREDLERMDVVRSWPMRAWKVFLATILPEVVLVTVLLVLAVLARMAIAGMFPIEVFGVLALIGPAVLGWVAIDNTVFLFAPVRLTPGSEGMLQQAGRSLVLMALRILATGVVVGLVVGVAAIAWYGRGPLEYSNQTAIVLASIGSVLVMSAECVFLVYLGGRALERFDVARDR